MERIIEVVEKIVKGIAIFLWVAVAIMYIFPEEARALIFWARGYQPCLGKLVGRGLEVEAELQCMSAFDTDSPQLEWRLWEDGWNGALLITRVEGEAFQKVCRDLVPDRCGEFFTVDAEVERIGLLKEPSGTVLYIEARLLAATPLGGD